ncbi:MAG: hypothetical protein COA79_21690 [Planctomycetota bacterium]|nr:MAG: hypothetical protein COA79_21690 [Planctomycetota bacterium]
MILIILTVLVLLMVFLFYKSKKKPSLDVHVYCFLVSSLVCMATGFLHGGFNLRHVDIPWWFYPLFFVVPVYMLFMIVILIINLIKQRKLSETQTRG